MGNRENGQKKVILIILFPMTSMTMLAVLLLPFDAVQALELKVSPMVEKVAGVAGLVYFIAALVAVFHVHRLMWRKALGQEPGAEPSES